MQRLTRGLVLCLLSAPMSGVLPVYSAGKTYHVTSTIDSTKGTAFIKVDLQSIIKRGDIVYLNMAIDIKKPNGGYHSRNIGAERPAAAFNCNTGEYWEPKTNSWTRGVGSKNGFWTTYQFVCNY